MKYSQYDALHNRFPQEIGYGRLLMLMAVLSKGAMPHYFLNNDFPTFLCGVCLSVYTLSFILEQYRSWALYCANNTLFKSNIF